MRTYISAPRSDEEIEALEKRVEELETKLREAERRAEKAETIISHSSAALGGDYAPEQVPEAIKQAFALMEKVERERDEARERLEPASRHIHDTTHERMVTWENCRRWSCPGDRAALGEKPPGVPDCNGGTPECRVVSEDQCPGHATWCPKWRKVMRPGALKDAAVTRPTDTELATMSWFDLLTEARRARAAETLGHRR